MSELQAQPEKDESKKEPSPQPPVPEEQKPLPDSPAAEGQPSGSGKTAEESADRQEESAAPTSQPAPKEKKEEPPKPVREGKSSELNAEESQKKQRGENQDFLRVLGQFAASGIPLAYIDHIQVANDFVMGGKSGSGADVSPAMSIDSAEVTDKEIAKIREVFQPPRSFRQAVDTLRTNRIVALVGRPHAGKRAVAISMALDLDASPALRELSPDGDIPKQVTRLLAAAEPGLYTVMIVDGLMRDAAATLKPPIDALFKALEHKNCYLIFCLQPEISLPSTIKRVTIEPPPVSSEILFQAHLQYYQGTMGEQVETLLENEEQIQRIINEEQLSPRQADALAERIVAAVHYNLGINEALSGVIADFMDEEISQWIGETADVPEESTMRIALAVFSGWTLSAIMEASSNLKERLFPPPPPHEDGTSEKAVEAKPSPLKKPISDTLRRAGARRVRRNYLTEYSDRAPVEVVELEKSSYSKALLKYLWQEIYEWQAPLLDWLILYATHGPREMRTRAAGAIGALASVDFPEIRGRAFYPWANTDITDSDQRRAQFQALANALGVLIWDDEQAANVLGLLDYWAENGSISMKWAATRAYSSVGLRYPQIAVNHWRAILENEIETHIVLTYDLGIRFYASIHENFVQSLLDSILNLFTRAVEMPHRLRSVYEQLVSSLAEWADLDEKDSKGKSNGLTLFILATDIRFPPEDESGERDEWPPAMLQVAHTQSVGAYHQALASLLRKSLNHADSEFSEISSRALLNWIDFVEEHQWFYDTLADILKSMLALPDIRQREYGRLWRYLHSWAHAPKKNRNTAQKLLEDLNLTR